MIRRSFFPLQPLLWLFAVWLPLPTAGAGEPHSPQPYERIRYPTFSDGMLESLLEADQAEAYDLTESTPRINLKNVFITLYERIDPDGSGNGDAPPPVEMTIQSDRGYFLRRPPEPGAPQEDIVNLEGNVVIRRMRRSGPGMDVSGRRRRLDPGVETEIRCQHAQWNDTAGKLNGDGEVLFLQEDSLIEGTGFLYVTDKDRKDGGSGTRFREWGGIMFIEHNARMEINRADGLTEITCRDTASYRLTEREIQFEGDVQLRRPGLLMQSDILKVFLQREEDYRPEESGALPGEVRNVVAIIGKRPGSVVITGYELDESGRYRPHEPLYTARGGRADYALSANRITLTDSRVERTPEVEFGDGRNRISDRNLEFVFSETAESGEKRSVLETLMGGGGQGQVSIQPEDRPEGGAGDRVDISYKGNMEYSRPDGRIRFGKSVFLKQGDVRIRSENLDVRLAEPDGRHSAVGLEGRIRRIVAETDVLIQDGDLQRDGREATAQRAEYESGRVGESGVPDAVGASYAYILRLFGPPQRTPPHPMVRDSRGNQITAPEIHMRRLIGSGLRPGFRERRLIFAAGGTIVSEFVTRSDNALEAGKVISIKCERAMEYNEANELAWFEGDVQAVSDDPGDSYTLVSDRLVVNLPETANPDNPEESTIRIRRIDASGKAVFRQDERACEANRIIRDFPTNELEEGDIYLEGVPAQGGLPPQMAVYREEMPGGGTGSMFVAPRIMSSANGDLIRANGPGQLSMPDEIPGLRSEIHFEGAAHYEAAGGGEAGGGALSFAKFRRGVFLRQPSRNLTLRQEDDGRRRDGGRRADDGDDRVYVERVGRLTRAEARAGVVVEHSLPRQGRRVAAGDRGTIEFLGSGNVIRLSANRQQNQRRFAVAKDNDGKTLTAPDIEIREGEGFTRASGPGELQLPGAASGSGGGMVKNSTRVIYGERGSMVYNELGLNIRTSDNVRIIQAGPDGGWNSPSLDGRCDRLDIFLLEPPVPGARGSDALTQVSRMDARGGVLIRSYADPPPDNLGLTWLSRPGITFFTRGDQAEFLPREGRIVISCQPGRRSELLLNMVDEGSPPRKQRLKAERFVLDTSSMPRRWTSEGQLESQPLGEGEPFEFSN